MAPAARVLADWCAGLTWNEIPETERALAGLRVLDSIGLALVARRSEAGRIAEGIARRHGGTPEATLAGSSERLPASWAAFGHGVLAHANDFDDTFALSVVHPGSVAVSAALAVAEATGAAPSDTATAITAGYEVAARIGGAAGRNFHARGFHATGTVGPFVAAAVAGRLYGLDGEKLANAFGLAGSMSGGLMEFMTDGTWSKWLHTGWSAHGGIIAAQMAGDGFRGPETVLDGRHGLYAAFVGDGVAELDILGADLGSVWRGSESEFKIYPCAHVIQPYIDAAIAMAAEHGLVHGDITEVRCLIAPWAVPIVCEPRAPKLRPSNAMEAIASLPYGVAVGLIDGMMPLDALGEACRGRAEVLALTERVVHVADETLGTGFDGRMEIALRDGRVLSADAPSLATDPAKVIAKFRRNAAAALEDDQIEAMISMLHRTGGIDVAALVPVIAAARIR
jgi:2-methylcitrate dehydratase PrpD